MPDDVVEQPSRYFDKTEYGIIDNLCVIHSDDVCAKKGGVSGHLSLFIREINLLPSTLPRAP